MEDDFNSPDLKIDGCKDISTLIIPIYPEWVEYKGEIYVSQLNFERTKTAKRPMFDLSYCMTRALNQNIMKTVAYDHKKFKISNLESMQL